MVGPMSSRQLFRQEAIEFQRGQREFGEIALLQPVSTKLLAWLLAAVVTIAIVFLCFAQFSRKQTVPGFLTPAAGTLKVFPDREGVVTNLYVKEGQQVKAGDPLFTVGTPQIAADGEDVNAAKLASLKQQKETLAHQIAAAKCRGGTRAPQHTRLRDTIRDRRFARPDRPAGATRPARRNSCRSREGPSRKGLYVRR